MKETKKEISLSVNTFTFRYKLNSHACKYEIIDKIVRV